jgi:hypothetical protein
VTGPAGWHHLRRPAGRHRGVPSITETTSLPQPSGRPIATATLAEPEAPPEPDRIVECGFCHVSGLSSQMASIGGGQYRCARADGDACVRRYVRYCETGGRPAPLLSSAELVAAVPAETLPPLPVAEPEPGPVDVAATWTPAQYALDAADKTSAERAAAEQQQEATQKLAAWSGGKTLAEDEEPGEAAAEPDADDSEPAPVAAENSTPDGAAPDHAEEGDEDK